MSQQHAEPGASALPPLPGPEASADERGRAVEARMIARKGAAPSLEDYRRAFAGCGLAWPGDDVILREHPVADSAA